MKKTISTQPYVAPSATAGDEGDLDAWNALSRDEQVRRYRETLTHPACDTIVDESMSDILAAGRQL